MSNYSRIAYSSQASSQWPTGSNSTVKLKFVVFRSKAHVSLASDRPALVLYDHNDPHVGFLVFKDPGSGFYTAKSHPNNTLGPISSSNLSHIGTTVKSSTLDIPISVGSTCLDVLRVFKSTLFIEKSNDQAYIPWTFRSYVERVINALVRHGIVNLAVMGMENTDDLIQKFSPYLPDGREIMDHSKQVSASSFQFTRMGYNKSYLRIPSTLRTFVEHTFRHL